jgi:hypothetical protein
MQNHSLNISRFIQAISQHRLQIKRSFDLKRSFLRNYPEYSSGRALAYNYTLGDKLWETDENISGFEKRVQRLLGF